MTAAGAPSTPAYARRRDIFIRRAGRADVHAVAELWERAGLPASRSGFRNEIARLRRRDPELVLIALADGRLVGAIAGSYDGRTAVVSRLAVDERVRRQGVGGSLVAALRDQLVGLGARDDELLVLDGAEQADEFWRAIGFEPGKLTAYVVRQRGQEVTPPGSSSSAARSRLPRR